MGKRIRANPLAALWVATVVMVLGRLLDLRWHATHDEFEGTSQQLEAHWLVWLGVLLLLFVAAMAVREGLGGSGFRVTLVSAGVYVPVVLWHFIEHANGADPEPAHILLAITNLGMVAGAVIALFESRQRPAAGASP